MKIQAITNTDFKGLYTDKSAQNRGNWKIEYQPYSWEKLNMYKFGTASQEEWNILANSLPDNEKHFTETKPRKYDWYPKEGRESCRDILGTEFYYHDFETKKMRNVIDHKEALNLEDSLNVLNRKLARFLDLKEEEMKSLEDIFKSDKEIINKHSADFDHYSSDYDDSFLSRTNDKKYNKQKMVEHKNGLKEKADTMFDNIQKYIGLRTSSEQVKEKRLNIEQEIALINKAKNSGNLIDISQRVYVYDPNKKLWDALQNIQAVKNKLVALPHRTISVREILNEIGAHIKECDIPEKAIEYIDMLIKYRR